MDEIIQRVAERVGLNRNNTRAFLNEAFTEIAVIYDLSKDFQRRAAIFGKAFESCFKVIMREIHPDIKLTPNFSVPEACLVAGGEADFAVISGFGLERRIVAIIETKGSADQIICNGEIIRLPRPGMLRTDTVKKAICNAYQVSRALPDALFFIATSHVPTTGNAYCMCKLAEGDIVDKIIDVSESDDLDEMASMIRKRLK